ncbi:EAL domain-containing protein [Reinekea marinisedimentorum]|uniref:Diguanylate cyclase (GGDEF)-like protein n=1 Tax=Reinekea marinisedimentorum TaxID=230495 RepID=A0A4R3IC46_9GAMM|nr:EAL domain-containing protein [Reinekea marinisedimentorum]TCS43126.1 diguanylate cyclase (GGDEF)-like protein [Reinekea marinisedimentorum]
MKLQWQFNLVMIPLVVVPLLIIGSLAYRYLLDSEVNQMRGEMASEINQLAIEINVMLSQAESDLEILATDRVISYYLSVRNQQVKSELFLEQVLERFDNFHQAVDMYDEIRIVLPDGSEDARWGRSEYINASDTDNNVTELLLNESPLPIRYRTIDFNLDSKQWSLYTYRALQQQSSSEDDSLEPDFRGYIASTVSLERFRQKFYRLADKPGFYIEFTDYHGVPKVHFGDERVQQLIDEGSDRDLIRVVIQPMAGYQIRYSALKTAAHAQSLVLSNNIYAVTLVFIVFTVLALWALLRKTVLRPLTKLMVASRDVSNGTFAPMPMINTNREFRHLSDCFNSMISTLEQNQERIQFIADHDSLTDLPNRRMFHYLLNNVVAFAKRDEYKTALLFFDIDNFKLVNDSLGHGVGDQLLMQVSSRIKELVRATDAVLALKNRAVGAGEELLARLGGDEFTLILPSLNNELCASSVAQRILDSLQQEFIIGEHRVNITASIGIAIYPDNGDSVEELVKNADIAMYHAKASGKNNYKYFNEELNELLKFRIQQERELCSAIKNKEFELFLQPLVNSTDESIYGFETLLRWHHPSRGMVSPDQFIPLAEESGLIVEIGHWVMFEACRIARDWIDAGHDTFKFSVNVSSIQFERQDVYQLIKDALEKYAVPAETLVIELTETAIMTKHSEKSGVLQSVRKLGVKVALDDFGSGYSSLSYLRNLPVDYLKIDRQFIVESRDKSEVRSIINAIAIMAHALDLTVVAEGVEKPGEARFLNSIGCDLIQGYYYSKPVPETEALQFVRQWRQFCRALRVLRRQDENEQAEGGDVSDRQNVFNSTADLN